MYWGRYGAGNDTENDKFFNRTRTDISGVPNSLQWLQTSYFSSIILGTIIVKNLLIWFLVWKIDKVCETTG